MSVASDLQTVVSRVSLAVAGGDKYGRVELERLARELANIRDAASSDQRHAVVIQMALSDVLDGVAEREAGLSRFLKPFRDKLQRAVPDAGFVGVPDLGTAQ